MKKKYKLHFDKFTYKNIHLITEHSKKTKKYDFETHTKHSTSTSFNFNMIYVTVSLIINS